MTDCRWTSSTTPRVLGGRHGEDCAGDCAGCLPCPERHCAGCGGREHVGEHEWVGPACINSVRQDLDAIASLYAKLPGEVEHRGVTSEAMVLLGPACDPEARGHLEASAAAGRIDVELEDGTGSHPLLVTATWAMVVRDTLGHREPDDRATVEGEAGYLDRQLTTLSHDAWFAMDDMAADVRRCRAHMEAVLRDGEQVERGAPCLTCRRPVHRITDKQGRVTYECQTCHKQHTENEYRLAVQAAHLAHADRLIITDLAARIGVSASSIRRWAGKQKIQEPGKPPFYGDPLLLSCGRDASGRKVYRVADAERVRDTRGDATGDQQPTHAVA